MAAGERGQTGGQIPRALRGPVPTGRGASGRSVLRPGQERFGKACPGIGAHIFPAIGADRRRVPGEEAVKIAVELFGQNAHDAVPDLENVLGVRGLQRCAEGADDNVELFCSERS